LVWGGPVTVLHSVLLVVSFDEVVSVDDTVLLIPVNLELRVTSLVDHSWNRVLHNIGSDSTLQSQRQWSGGWWHFNLVSPVDTHSLLPNRLEWCLAKSTLLWCPGVIFALLSWRNAFPLLTAQSAPNLFSIALNSLFQLLIAVSGGRHVACTAICSNNVNVLKIVWAGDSAAIKTFEHVLGMKYGVTIWSDDLREFLSEYWRWWHTSLIRLILLVGDLLINRQILSSVLVSLLLLALLKLILLECGVRVRVLRNSITRGLLFVHNLKNSLIWALWIFSSIVFGNISVYRLPNDF